MKLWRRSVKHIQTLLAIIVVEATVADWDPTTRELKLTYINGDLVEGSDLIGQTTGATYSVDNFSTIDIDLENNDFAQNQYLEDFGDDIIDWTEGNPFGEYGNKTDEASDVR